MKKEIEALGGAVDSGVAVSVRRWIAVSSLYGFGYLLIIASFLLSDHPEMKRQWITGDLVEGVSAPRIASMFFLAAVVSMSLGYAWMLKRARVGAEAGADRSRTFVFLVALVSLFYTIPPFLSTDVFNYYQQGWVVAEKGESPYTTPAGTFEDYPGSDVTKGGNALARSPYGPVWTQVERLTVHFSGGSVWVGAMIFKAYAAVAVLAIAALVLSISQKLDPGRRAWSTVAVGANPLVLIEGPGMGHNDIVALAVVVFGIWQLVKAMERKWAGLAVVGLASVVKVTAAPVIFVFLHWLLRLRESYRDVLLTLLKAVVPIGLIFVASGVSLISTFVDAPLLFGFANVNLGYEIGLTPVSLIRDVIVTSLAASGAEVSASSVKIVVLAIALGLGAGASLWMLSRSRTFESYLGTLGPICLIVTLVVSIWRPWWVLWPLVLASLGPWSRWTVAIILYSLLALSTHLITRSTGIFCGCI